MEDNNTCSAEGEALLTILADRLGVHTSIIVHPGELREEIGTRLGWRDPPTPEVVGSWLRRFGFTKGTPPRDRDGVRYKVTVEHLAEIRKRYHVMDAYTPAPT